MKFTREFARSWQIFDLMLFGFCRELSDLSQVIAKRINLSGTLSFFPNEGQLKINLYVNTTGAECYLNWCLAQNN